MCDTNILTMSEEEVIQKHARLTHRIIRNKFGNALASIEHSTNLSYDDLVQVGLIGLIKAKRKYDPTQNVKFTTYATFKILSELQRTLRSNTKVNLTQSVYDTRFKIIKQELQDKPPEEIAEILNVPLQTAKEAILFNDSYESMDRPINQGSEEKETLLSEVLPDNELFYEEYENQNLIEKFISTLTETEQSIWRLYSKGLKQNQIAEITGYSKGYVCKILKNIEKKASLYGKQCGLR